MNHVSPAKSMPQATSREALLIAAGELMSERGSVEISFADIARRSGLNPALIKYYFGNKRGMLMELVRMALRDSMAGLGPLVSSSLSPPEKLHRHISGVINAYFYYPYINRLIHHLITGDDEASGKAICEEIVRPLVDAESRILEEGVAAGIFRPVDPMHFYFHVVGACDTLFQSRAILKHGFGIPEVTRDLKREYANHLYETVMGGLLTDEAKRKIWKGRAGDQSRISRTQI